MTEQEIEAAYVYRTQQYMLSDARMHLNTVAFGCANASCIYSTETLEEEKQKFLGNYGITFEEASSPKMLERFIDSLYSLGALGSFDSTQPSLYVS